MSKGALHVAQLYLIPCSLLTSSLYTSSTNWKLISKCFDECFPFSFSALQNHTIMPPKEISMEGFTNFADIGHDGLKYPCSPEGFSQTYFPKGGGGGGCCNPPLDYQYWRSYNPKFTTSV